MTSVSTYIAYTNPSTETTTYNGQYKIQEPDKEPTYHEYPTKQDTSATDKTALNKNNAHSFLSASTTQDHGLMITTSAPITTPSSDSNDRSLMISTSTPLTLSTETSQLTKSTSSHSDENEDYDDEDENESELNGSRPDHLKTRLCTVPDCRKRVRSKGLCKAHGGGRRCMVDGCERSSQGQGLCIRHGGGKRCTQAGCTKASQSNGLCKAHGGGLRCQFENCSKSSQGGGFCRAHGGGQRCEKEGCNKGAQRGGFCAGHGGSRFCQHPDCTKNDRGGGHCAEHGGGKRCGQPGCNKPARKKGKCSHHANNKAKTSKDGFAGIMMDMRQITTPVYNMPVMLKEEIDQQAHRNVYPPMMAYPRGNEYAKGYDHPLPLNAASSHYLTMHNDQRGYEHLGMQLHATPRHYLGPSPTNYKHPQHQASFNAPGREMIKPTQTPPNYSQQQWPSKASYYDMKESHQGYAPPPQYTQHMTSTDAAAYGNQRDYYSLHTTASADGTTPNGTNMMYYNNYPQHPLHSMDLL